MNSKKTALTSGGTIIFDSNPACYLTQTGNGYFLKTSCPHLHYISVLLGCSIAVSVLKDSLSINAAPQIDQMDVRKDQGIIIFTFKGNFKEVQFGCGHRGKL